MNLADPPGPGWYPYVPGEVVPGSQGWMPLPPELDPYQNGLRAFPFEILVDWGTETVRVPRPHAEWPQRAPEPPPSGPARESSYEAAKKLLASKPPPEVKKARPVEKLGPPTVEQVGKLLHTERLSARAQQCAGQHAYAMRDNGEELGGEMRPYFLVCERCGSEKEIGPA